jgi:hypothetical protein
MKRLTLKLAAAALLAFFAGCATIEFTSGDFSYCFNSNGVSITGYRGSGGDVVIPAQLGGRPVTVIGGDAFRGKGLTSVTIPDSVRVIAGFAFANNKLTSVTIPESVTDIKWWAFYSNQLTSVTILNRVTSIWGGAFANNRLTSVTIPEGESPISYNTFENNQLTSVTIPNSVTSIGKRAFYNNQLTNVTIPNSVTSIGESAFANNRLTSVTIPASVTTIGELAFSNNNLTSVTIPNSVTSIGEGAFANNRLTSVTLPSGIRTIGAKAFVGSIEGLLAVYGNRAGAYEKRGSQWYYNGTALADPARLVCHSGIYIASIDGKDVGGDHDVYLQPGFHSIEVRYRDEGIRGVTYSQGTVTFEHRLMLESAVYDLTGEIQGGQILFRITRR